jgi:hypothetical protein
MLIITRSVSFDVALCFGYRAEGLAIYLAQPAGLGFEANTL